MYTYSRLCSSWIPFIFTLEIILSLYFPVVFHKLHPVKKITYCFSYFFLGGLPVAFFTKFIKILTMIWVVNTAVYFTGWWQCACLAVYIPFLSLVAFSFNFYIYLWLSGLSPNFTSVPSMSGFWFISFFYKKVILQINIYFRLFLYS